MINLERSAINRSILSSDEPIYLDASAVASFKDHLTKEMGSDRNFFDIDEILNPDGDRPVRSRVDLDALFGATATSLARPSVPKSVLRVGQRLGRQTKLQSAYPSSFNRTYRNLEHRAEPHGKWNSAREVFRKWISLKADWDSDGALSPSHKQLTAAFEFLKRAEQFYVPEAKPYIASDSEIGFSWVEEGANVSFLIEGRFLAFCPARGKDPVRVSGPLDIASASTELFRALSKLI